MTKRFVRFLGLPLMLGMLPVFAVADGGSSASPLPTTGLFATFQAGGNNPQVFHTSITNPTGMADAIALWRGLSDKRIPSGRLACAATVWNSPWHWHQVPSSITFTRNAIEVCDGAPSDVERNCLGFGMGYYCPWQVQMVELRDCRTDRRCPLVPR